MATRPSINDPFGDPSEVTALGATGGSYSPTVTGDGLSLFWVEVIGGDFQILPLDACDEDIGLVCAPATFNSAPVNVPELNSPQQDWRGWISPDGCRFSFGSLRVNPRRALHGIARSLRKHTHTHALVAA